MVENLLTNPSELTSEVIEFMALRNACLHTKIHDLGLAKKRRDGATNFLINKRFIAQKLCTWSIN